MGRLFGTDGVRGIANEELTGELAYKLGRAGGYFLVRNYQGKGKPVMLIGKDTRISGDMLEAALVAGMTSAGINVVKLGIIPTPGVAYLTRTQDVQGGVMISASHNPIADNGIKFFDGAGYKLSDVAEQKIETIIFSDKYNEIPSPTHNGIGNLECKEKLVNKYINYLIDSVSGDFTGMKVVLDCANGAAYHVAPTVLKALGAELKVIHNHPDGEKINVNCGSTYPQVIQHMVKETGADLGIAHDGDADRIIAVDEKGNLVDGDKIMAICAMNLLKSNKLKNNTLVTTAYSNLGLKEVIELNQGKIAITKNGDRYVLQEMLEKGYNLGGEKSGHIIFLDYNTTGDGVLTALRLIETTRNSQKNLSQLASVMKPWPQILANVRVKKKEEWEQNQRIQESIKSAESQLGESGRIFVRESGTEPVIRVMLEGKDEKLLNKLESSVCQIIEEELN